jgi:hypothetical protein
MTEQIDLKWKWRENRDGDIGNARYKCFDIRIQDMDGDAAEWSIKRGDLYVAIGTERDIEPAQAKVMEILAYLSRAVDFNDFIARERRRRIREEAGIDMPGAP